MRTVTKDDIGWIKTQIQNLRGTKAEVARRLESNCHDWKFDEIIESLEVDYRAATGAEGFQTYKNCPGCSGTLHIQWKQIDTDGTQTALGVCDTCGGLIGEFDNLDESHGYVDGRDWHQGPDDPDNWRYFDFSQVDGYGKTVDRRHGWYHLQTGKIVQVG